MVDETQIADTTSPMDAQLAGIPEPVMEQQSPVEAEKPKETKVWTDEEVNGLVRKKKEEARERGRREAYEELQRRHAEDAAKAQQAQTQTQQPDTTGQPLTADDVKRLLSEHTEQMRLQVQGESLKNQFLQKVQAGFQKYPNFQDVLEDLDLGSVNPAMLDVLNSVDNTADVIKDFHDHPDKFDSILAKLRERPKSALNAVQSLSDSIKRNQTGTQVKTAKEPLSQIQPSRIGLGDNGLPENPTPSYFKKQSWLKG